MLSLTCLKVVLDVVIKKMKTRIYAAPEAKRLRAQGNKPVNQSHTSERRSHGAG